MASGSPADPIIVLAGSYREFEDFRRLNRLVDGKTAIYGDHPAAILRVRASKVVAIGSFWNRVDAGPLHDMALMRVRSHV